MMKGGVARPFATTTVSRVASGSGAGPEACTRHRKCELHTHTHTHTHTHGLHGTVMHSSCCKSETANVQGHTYNDLNLCWAFLCQWRGMPDEIESVPPVGEGLRRSRCVCAKEIEGGIQQGYNTQQAHLKCEERRH